MSRLIQGLLDKRQLLGLTGKLGERRWLSWLKATL